MAISNRIDETTGDNALRLVTSRPPKNTSIIDPEKETTGEYTEFSTRKSSGSTKHSLNFLAESIGKILTETRDMQSATKDESGDSSMDDGYKKVIDKLNEDFRDHKQENRDRDARIQPAFPKNYNKEVP